jgi:hypothetical protein
MPLVHTHLGLHYKGTGTIKGQVFYGTIKGQVFYEVDRHGRASRWRNGHSWGESLRTAGGRFPGLSHHHGLSTLPLSMPRSVKSLTRCLPLLVLFAICASTGCQTAASAKNQQTAHATNSDSPNFRPHCATECASSSDQEIASTFESLPNAEHVQEPKPLQTFQKWNPIWWFGNVDDPDPPDWYRPEQPFRRFLWRLRNPLHNFVFYVVGVADKDFTRSGRYPADVFKPSPGWNWAVTRYKWARLPFASFHHGRFKWYAGWRERGNFGFKLTLSSSP